MKRLVSTLAVLVTVTLSTAVCSSFSAAYAQQASARQLSGKVVDSAGQPVIAASVILPGTSVGVMTDMNGAFSLTATSAASVLEVSCLGYVTASVKLTESNVYNITLAEDNEYLNEVVVVGYGTQKKVNLTGAVSSVNFEKMSESRPIHSTASALAGMSAGLSVRTSSSDPGFENNTIRVRGTGTLNSAVPLYIVDGVESNIAYVNPQDIASISILKDAASCAIYGNRGANGVVLITTKKGSAGNVNVNYHGNVSFNSPMHRPVFMTDYADYMELMNESRFNIGQADNFGQATIDTWREAAKSPNATAESGYPNYVAYPNTDWQQYLYRNAASQEHNVSVIGRGEKSSYLLSGNYTNNPGLISNTGAKKYQYRANIDVKPTDWLTVGTQTYGSVIKKQSGNHGTAINYLTQTTPGLYPFYDGFYGFPSANEESATANNPLANVESDAGVREYSRIKTAVYAQVDFLKDFSFKALANYGRYWYDYQTKVRVPQQVKMNFATGNQMTTPALPKDLNTSFTADGQWDYTIQATLNWGHKYGVHDISALAGYEEFYFYAYNQGATKKGLIDATIWAPSTATEPLTISGKAYDYSSRSYFGRVNYVIMDKYLFEANMRYDGSSRFAEDVRWGLFPSVSAGWRIDQEDFMKNVGFDNLKLRASWGKLGNNSIDNYAFLSTYAANNYVIGNTLTNGLAVSAYANPLLRWETTTSADLGLDIAVLNNRLTAEIDVYDKNTDGILYRPNISYTAGNATAPYQNIAVVNNKGAELTLGWRDSKGEFSYSVNGNFAYNHNRVAKYKGALEQGWKEDESGNRSFYSNLGDVSTGTTERILEGHTISEFYMLTPYSGNASYFNADGTVNVNGGPKDGMIRTENDMKWLEAMVAAGHQFYPQQGISKSKIWYGDYIYADLDGDGVYGNTYDNSFVGKSQTPKFTFGLQASASWKGFDFSMSWAGAAGFYLYWNGVGANATGTRLGYNILNYIAKDHYFFDPENPSDPRTNTTSKTARLTCNENNNQQGAVSTIHLYKGDYFKLKNLTVGYTLPEKAAHAVYMQGARVYLSGENLFNITKYPGQDPEMGAGFGYVTMRQLAVGVNLTF